MSVAGHFQEVPPEAFSRVFVACARGLVGLDLELGDARARVAPSAMIARNLAFGSVRDRFLARSGLSRAEFDASGRVRFFLAAQRLVGPAVGGRSVVLFRGAPTVAPVGAARLAADIARAGARWLEVNAAASGAWPYKLSPCGGEALGADNAIRRFLAIIALFRYAAFTRRRSARVCAEAALVDALRRYLVVLGDGRAVIVERGGVAKLGAAALAGLAIVESPAPTRFGDVLQGLLRSVASLAGGVSGFRTFFFPASRDGQNWNFYAGEALLFQCEAARRGVASAPSRAGLARTFEAIGVRHRRAANPAFVPWYAQAGLSLFALTRRSSVAGAVAQACDWLLQMQQWDGVDPDLRGRFYAPDRPDFGPPHASSTGVYVEGLADAAVLARAVGAGASAARFDRAVARGLRSLRQLQFRDWRDAFYVERRERVFGALRTEVYDNTVRLDNTAHALAGAVKVLRPPIL